MDVQWNPDSSQVAFVSTSRNHQQENLRVADAGTGAIREVLEEKGETFLESGNGTRQLEVPARLERSDLVLAEGQLGPALPARSADRQTEEPDHERRRQRDAAAARRRSAPHAVFPGRRQGSGTRSVLPPLLSRHAWTASRAQLLTPEDADHDVSLSPSGKYFVDNYSKPDVAVDLGAARRRPARLVLQLEKMDISRLLATGWKPPMPITVKDRGGVGESLRPDRIGRPTSIRRRSIRSSTTSIPVRRPAASAAASSRPRAATRRRSPSSASSSCRSTAWARRGDRSASTRRTTATWATTRCPTRSPA